jgi:hypothetical protein
MVDDGRPINVGRSLVDAAVGAYTAVPATALDAARRGVTSLVGGDPNTLPGGQDFYSSRAFGTLDQGLSNFAEANASLGRNIQRGVLGLVGAQPAAAPQTPPLQASAPAAAPVATPTAAPVEAPNMLGQGDVNALNAQIATSLAGLRPEGGIMQPAQRGVYSQQNTTPVAPRTNGINFGFGVGGQPTAQQYLAQMQVVDQQRAQARTNREAQNNLQYAQGELSSARTPGEILRARQLVSAATPMATQQAEAAAQGAQLTQRGQVETQLAELQNAGALTRAELDAQARLASADLTGQYGLAGRQAAAEATLGAARLKEGGATSQNAAAQAQLRQLQLQLALDQLGAGDLDAAASIVTGSGRPNQRIALDMLQNPIGTYDAAGNLIPYTPAQLEAYRQASGLAQGR